MTKFKKRETIVMQEREKYLRRPLEAVESSISETSEEEPQAKPEKKKPQTKKGKVTRNDMLNLPSSDSEKMKRKLDNLHVESSFERDKSSEESQRDSKLKLKEHKRGMRFEKYKEEVRRSMNKKYIRRGRTNSFEIDKRDHLDETKNKMLQSKKNLLQVDVSKPSSVSQSHDQSRNIENEKHYEAPEITNKKLEDAEYKDLNQRYHNDEGDSNYVLNDEEEIKREIKNAEDTNIELNESIEKLEEEQDLVFKRKVTAITKALVKEMEALGKGGESHDLTQIQDRLIGQVFQCFLENKQELLKKIANKLAAARDVDDYEDDGYDGEGDHDQSSPRLDKPRKKSNASRMSRISRNHRNKRRVEEDTDMEDDMKSIDDMDEYNNPDGHDDDYAPAIMDRSDNSENDVGFVDNSEIRSKHRGVTQQRRRRHRPTNKDSESQTTFLMNIQTTADLISYVKRRQNKNRSHKKRSSRVPSKPRMSTAHVNRISKGYRDVPHLRYMGMIGANQKAVEIQTEDINILDLRASEINLAEVYHFDKISSCLKKITIEKGTDAEILRQFEYIHKDTIRTRYRSRSSIIGRYGKNLNKQDQFKKNINDTVTKTEMHRLNEAYKALISKVKDYEHEQAYLEEQRACIESKFPLFKENENDVFNRGWRKGYEAGYSRGNSNGFFKGSLESQYIGRQKGIEEGMQEGWNFGFDEGFKTGIRTVFRDARDAGIDLSSLDMMEYISHEDKIKGMMRNLFSKLTKVFATSDRLEAANKLHEKFMQFSDKRKKLAVKVGKKNIVKLITSYFTNKINTNSSNILLHEFVFDECIKKYGNSKMADKKLIQIFAGAVYHQKLERVDVFCRALHLSNKRNYSNDIFNLYLYIFGKFQKEYNTRINAIKDENTDGDNDLGPFFKAVEIFKEMFEEKIPISVYSKLKNYVEKRMVINKATMKLIDVDRFMNYVVTNYMKYYINYNSNAEIVYNAWTLYEKNYITMNELYTTIEIIKPETIKVDIPEAGKQATIPRNEFYELFTRHFKEKQNEFIYSFQYKEVMENVDVFETKKAKKLFQGAIPYVGTLNEFKQEFQEVSVIIKEKLNELYKGKKWKQLNRIDEKSTWHQKLIMVNNAIGDINPSILKMSLVLIRESIDFFLQQKIELMGGRDDEDEEGEDGEGDEEKKVPQNAESDIHTHENSVEKTSAVDSKVHPSLLKPSKNMKRTKIVNAKAFKTKDDSVSTPRANRSEFGKPNTARKSFSTQKTTTFASMRKPPRKAMKNKL